MADSIIFYSKKPLDFDVFSRCLEIFGDTFIQFGVLHCNFWGIQRSYEFYFSDADDLSDASPEELEYITSVTGTGKPFATQLVYRHVMPDPILLSLPAWDNIWVSEGADFLLSLKEVQQRIRLGIQYLVRGDREVPVDLIAHFRGRQYGGALVLLDDGQASSDTREKVLQERLTRCASYVASGKFRDNHYVFSSDDPTVDAFAKPTLPMSAIVEIVCVVPPTPTMRAIAAVSDPNYPDAALSVEFLSEEEFRQRHAFVPRDLPSLRKV